MTTSLLDFIKRDYERLLRHGVAAPSIRLPRTELSLFSGYGGIGLGLKLAVPSIRTVGYVEREAYAAAVLVARMEDASLEEAPVWDDVSTFDGKPWRGRVDLISGGFPCQDVSLAGKGGGLDGKRSGLWFEYARIVREVEPRFVFVENVRALTSRGLDRVLGTLADLGFDAEWGCYTAAEIGAPHKRERIFILAHSQRDAGIERGSGDAGEGAVGRDVGGGRGRALADPERESRSGQSDTSQRPAHDRVADRWDGEEGVGCALAYPERLRRAGRGDVETWETWETRRQVVLAKKINGNGMGMPLTIAAVKASGKMWPTPRASEGTGGGDTFSRGNQNLRGAAKNWPTPTVGDSKMSGSAGYSTESGRAEGTTLTDAAVRGWLPGTGKGPNRWPTPTVQDSEAAGGSGFIEQDLPEDVAAFDHAFHPDPTTSPDGAPPPSTSNRRRLNQRFVEWLMGLPENWVSLDEATTRAPTNSGSSATGSFRRWLRERSSNFFNV